ncbi:hypothetical protein GOP47_0002476 [Adiantum capillus-veneris]|uniref:Integral membrane bound transporter domain-containing protein n=1 Tax=Adiantum capillus-veneris TaxID=13818 RepID=A0A9D4ZP51_ADICA|nr:hypothetical protein GOP47_0002476 [Adiantum capillus-veneris]
MTQVLQQSSMSSCLQCAKTHGQLHVDHEQVCWRSRFSTAFRTGLGCFLYGLLLHLLLHSKHLQKHYNSASWLAFPIFGYVIVVRVVGESNLGQALLESTAMVLGAAQGILMSYVMLYLFYDYFTNVGIVAACIFVSSFIIALPTSLNIFHKRVALAHTAIVCITSLAQHPHMDFMFPIKLFATTIIAASCGMLAILLPMPRQAHDQAQSHTNLSVQVATQRLKALVDGFCIDDNTNALALSLKAKCLNNVASTLHKKINSIMEDMKREARFLPCHNSFKRERLELVNDCLISMHEHLTHMELALQEDVSSSPPKRLKGRIMRESLAYATGWVILVLNSMNLAQHFNIIKEGQKVICTLDETVARMRKEVGYPTTRSMHASHGHQDIRGAFQHAYGDNFVPNNLSRATPHNKIGAPFSFAEHAQFAFFFFSIQKLVVEMKYKFESWNCPKPARTKSVSPEPRCSKELCSKRLYKRAEKKPLAQAWFKLDLQQLKSVFRLALTMAIAGFLGYSFNKKKGYWADITVAMGFRALLKGDVYKIASLRTLGISCGSIYGLLVARSTVPLRVLRYVALIPWVILTSFLRKSRIFAYGGGLSSFTAAVVILASEKSKDYSDQDFTVLRIVEALLGLASFVVVEILICPHRARSRVKPAMLIGIDKLQQFAGNILEACSYQEQSCANCWSDELRSEYQNLREMTSGLTQLVKEAAEEPQFWFEPFQEKIHLRVVEEERKVVEMLHLGVDALDGIKRAARGKRGMESLLLGELKAVMDILIEKKVIPTLDLLATMLSFDRKAESFKEPLVKAPLLSDEGCLEAFERGALQLVYTLYHSNQLRVERAGSNAALLIENNCGFESLSNTMFLSLGTLAFSVKCLLHHSKELHQASLQLFQTKNPLMPCPHNMMT